MPSVKLDARAAKAIDPHIEKAGRLNGVVVRIAEFPGWDSFGRHFVSAEIRAFKHAEFEQAKAWAAGAASAPR